MSAHVRAFAFIELYVAFSFLFFVWRARVLTLVFYVYNVAAPRGHAATRPLTSNARARARALSLLHARTLCVCDVVRFKLHTVCHNDLITSG